MRSHWLLLLGLLFACGRVESFADAQLPPVTPDAPVDPAPQPDGPVPPGPATVEVLSTTGDGSPGVGATAIFVNPDGSVAGTPVTDTQGRASATIQPGAMVTVISLIVDGGQLTTIMGIEPGDVIRVGTKRSTSSAETGRATLTFTQQAGVSGYRLFTPCSTGATFVAADASSVEVVYNAGCQQSTYDYALVSQFNNVDTNYVVLRDRAAGNAAFPSSWDTGRLTAAYTDVPANATSVRVDRTLSAKGRQLPGQSATATPAGTSLAVSIPAAIPLGDKMRINTSLNTAITGQAQFIIEHLAPGTSYGLRLSDEILPWLSALKADAATRTITYAQDGTGAFTAFVTSMAYTRVVGQTTQRYSWTIVAPTSTGTLALPDLPDAAGDAELRTTDALAPSGAQLIRIAGRTYRDLRQTLAGDGLTGELPKTTVSSYTCGRIGCR